MKQLGRLWRAVPAAWTLGLPWASGCYPGISFSQSFCSCWFEIDFYHLPQKRDLTNNYRNKWNWRKNSWLWTTWGLGCSWESACDLRPPTYISRVPLHLGIQSTTCTAVGAHWTKPARKWTWQFKPMSFNCMHIVLGFLSVRKRCLLLLLSN